MQKKLYISALIFFLPVVMILFVTEMVCRQLPSNYALISDYLDTDADKIELMALGTSQIKDGINPALMSVPAINLASGNQHHDTDFKLYKEISKRLPELNTVVLEASYSHFEMPHNGKDFWKNSVYNLFYDVNCFERPTWFKDRLLYISNPSYFSSQLLLYYRKNELKPGYNRYGFDTLNFEGRFKRLNFNEEKIAGTNFRINRIPDRILFKKNAELFIDMIETIKTTDRQIIIVKPPMYKTFLTKRVPHIVHRRDSLLNSISQTFPDIKFLDLEADTVNFKAIHYKNQSHLNPTGAKVFTQLLLDKLHE